MQNDLQFLIVFFVYCCLANIQSAQAQPWGDLQSIDRIHYQFVEPQHFEMQAELDGGCFKGDQTLLYSEINRKKVKPEYLQKEILNNKKTKSAFTAMVFIVNGQRITMNVLDDDFIQQYCLNNTNLPVSIQGDIVHLKKNGILEKIYFVQHVKAF